MTAPPPTVPILILASASPRRRDLLARIGIIPEAIQAAELDESPRSGETPRALALRLAEAKARTVSDATGNTFILAADTVVACGRRLLPKAGDPATVRHCLSLLSGRRHRVTTGIALITPDGRCRSRAVETIVTFKRLEKPEINWYVASGDGLGKAGGYAIQGLAEIFVRFLEGSHSNVVGLPLHETAGLLNGNGYPIHRLSV